MVKSLIKTPMFHLSTTTSSIVTKKQAITTTQTYEKGDDIKILTMLIPHPVGVVYNQNNNNKQTNKQTLKNTYSGLT